MSGTKDGGLRAAETNVKKYGKSFYAEIGRMGGSKRVAKGFAKMEKEKVRLAGSVGGRISKPGKK